MLLGQAFLWSRTGIPTTAFVGKLVSQQASTTHATISRGSSRFLSSSVAGGGGSAAGSRGYQKIVRLVLVASSAAGAGFILGRQSVPSHDHEDEEKLHLPNGYPRTCCEEVELTEQQQELVTILKRIVGKVNVLDGRQETTETSQFLKGARLGKGSALCIVKPNKLKQLIEIVQAVVDADCCVLVQGQNTGLVCIINKQWRYIFHVRCQLNLTFLRSMTTII